MSNHQQKQIDIINGLERQIKDKGPRLSLVTPVKAYESDPRICLTSVHIPLDSLKKKIQDEIIKPLREILPEAYFYTPDSLHITIKNIRVINYPPHFTTEDIEKAKQVFSRVVPQHKKFKVYFYRLLLFPNNLALISTTDLEFDHLVLDLDQGLKAVGLPDDKQYTNSKYFFSNMTLARFSNFSEKFIREVKESSGKIEFDPYTIDSVSLVTCNAVLKNRKIIQKWNLK